MSDPHKLFEVRCPVHGFIPLTDWEREIINQPAFQRLRRIRQLAWTDQVYPGAMHTRFEHSLGVMHLARGFTKRLWSAPAICCERIWRMYFHKTRVAFDHHLLRAMGEILPNGLFPPPTPEKLPEFLRWDDWAVLGALASGGGGEHGQRLATRDHYREAFPATCRHPGHVAVSRPKPGCTPPTRHDGQLTRASDPRLTWSHFVAQIPMKDPWAREQTVLPSPDGGLSK